ncbi:peptidase [Kitasatospora sp. NPDC001175]|uniref:peptidase n=1 Tax=Kitasatospora sp. NPDC001175 TaxID=3157103 RepID=UPI003CFF969C
MRTRLTTTPHRLAAGALLALGLLPALAPAASAASPSASPAGRNQAPATTSGTSFLTATTLAAGQEANVSASTGDYLYWAFPASEGQTDTVQVTVALPSGTDRHGPQTWAVELFDGLRRRQSCTAGPQNAAATPKDTSLSVSCTLRQIRSWAEPWSGDPLPGTYYIRLTTSDVDQQDLGLAAQVKLHITAKGGADDAQPEGGELKAPLAPPVNAGSPSAGASTAPTAAADGSDATRAAAPAQPKTHWYSDLFSGWNTRWFWTLGGGALAALAGVAGYKLTRHPRGSRLTRHPGPQG